MDIQNDIIEDPSSNAYVLITREINPIDLYKADRDNLPCTICPSASRCLRECTAFQAYVKHGSKVDFKIDHDSQTIIPNLDQWTTPPSYGRSNG